MSDFENERSVLQRPRPAVIGLPLKIALVTLCAIAAVVGGITWYSLQQMQQSSDRLAQTEAENAANSVADQLVPFDFQAEDATVKALLDSRLQQLVEENDRVSGLAIYGPVGQSGKVKPVAHNSLTRRTGTSERTVNKALKSGKTVYAESFRTGGFDRIWVPVFDKVVGGADPVGAVVLEYDRSDLTAGVAQSRQLILGASITGAFLLAALVLFLLQVMMFKPLIEMRSVMGRIAGGEKGSRMGWTRRDELGEVAYDFDVMVDELESAEQELARYIDRDPDTGLLTGDAFGDRAAQELSRARREDQPVSLVTMKLVQRDAEDVVALRDFAREVIRCIRPSDLGARMQDDSIVVLLIGADRAVANMVMQRLANRSNVASFWYGAAAFPDGAADRGELIGQASRALRSATEESDSGGGKICLASGELIAAESAKEDQLASQLFDEGAGTAGAQAGLFQMARSLSSFGSQFPTPDDCDAVADQAVRIADQLNFDQEQTRLVRDVAKLHGLGMLMQLGDSDEGDVPLARQASFARDLVLGAGMPAIAEALHELHGAWNERGSNIPLAARVVQVALALHSEGINAVTKDAGARFDPEVVASLLDAPDSHDTQNLAA